MKCLGQHHLYSQFFINPVLTRQFIAFSYVSASVDYNVPRFGGGIGLLFTRGSEGPDYLDRTNFPALYSYSVGSEDFGRSFGLRAGVTNRGIDQSKLVFGDQTDPTLDITPGKSAAAGLLPYNNKFYFDPGLGTNLAIGDFNIGAALQHINQRNESFTGTPVKLRMRINTPVSYRRDLNRADNIGDDEKSYIVPSVVFYKQTLAELYSVDMQYKHKLSMLGLARDAVTNFISTPKHV